MCPSLYWIFLLLSASDSVMDLERAIYLGLSSFPIRERIQLMMICDYSSFLFEEIWVDWQDNILFGIILFSVLANFNLTCGKCAFQIIRYRPLGPSGPGLRLALAPRGLDIAWGAPLLWAWWVGRCVRFSNLIRIQLELELNSLKSYHDLYQCATK